MKYNSAVKNKSMNYWYMQQYDESQNNYDAWEKLGRKEYTLYDSICIKY